MSKKTPSLKELTLHKQTPTLALGTQKSPRQESPKQKAKRRGQTLRLEEGAWKQLKHLAVDQGVCSHALLLEAVNDLFQKYGKAPIA